MKDFLATVLPKILFVSGTRKIEKQEKIKNLGTLL